MKRVYKYPIEITGCVKVTMPKGAKVLNVLWVKGELCIYALVDPKAEEENRNFRIFGTGHNISDTFNGEYIGTFLSCGGCFVFHLFEEKK